MNSKTKWSKLGAVAAVACMALGLASVTQAAVIGGGYNIDGGDPITSGQSWFTSPDGNVTHVNDGVIDSSSYWLPNSGPPITATIDMGRNYRITDLNLANSIFGQRATDGYNVTVSTTGAFAGEQTALVSGNMPSPAAGMTDISIAANQVGRYVRFTGTSVPVNNFNGGLQELGIGAIPNRAMAQIQSSPVVSNNVTAKAFTRTTALTDAAATWSLSLVTPTSGSVTQSVGKAVAVTPTLFAPLFPSTITDGIDTPANTDEILFSQTRQGDYSYGNATVDLGQRMIIDKLSLRNTAFNGNGTSNYIVRVANTLTDLNDDPGYTDLFSSNFAAVNEVDNFTLAAPVVGRYVRFIALDKLPGGVAFYTGLDELTVVGRTFTTSPLASGSGAIGDSSNFGTITAAGNLDGFNMLALDVNTSDGLNREIVQNVLFVPEPSAVILVAAGGLVLWRRSRASRA